MKLDVGAMLFAAMVATVAAPGVAEKLPWNAFDDMPPAEFNDVTLGAGPHTLVILGQVPVQFSYATGKACAEARKSIAKQVAAKALPGGGMIFSGARTICVPR